MIQKNRHYLNKKTGDEYVVTGYATHSENMEQLVIYHRVRGLQSKRLWVRPYFLFEQKFTEMDGSDIPPMEEFPMGLLDDGD